MDMPRPRLPHLHKEHVNGRVVWYVRIGHGPRTRLRSPYGSPEFQAEYDAAKSGTPLTGPRKAGKGTLQWLWDRYRESTAWADLSPATKRQRENIMRHVLERAGPADLADIDRASVIAAVDRRRETPAQAEVYLKVMRGLFAWGMYAQHVTSNPTEGVKPPKVRTEGFHIWTESECERFEARWPVGTRERLAFDVLLYTGLRRGDAVRLGRQHMRDGLFVIRTEKTGETAYIPILPPLVDSIAAGPCGDLAFIAGERGQPMVKEAFGNWFRSACNRAGVPGSAHGLRKVHATRAAVWLTEAELEALHGWERGSNMAKLYTNTVNRERLAQGAALKLKANMLFPHPVSGAGMRAKKNGKTDA
jgi:integrase